jgi:hypothetical protein
MPSCKGWQQSMSAEQDNRSLINSLKCPPTLISWQHNLQSLLRWQICLRLTTGFEWLNPSLDCFTSLSSRRPYSQCNNSMVPQLPGGTRIPMLLRTITKCCGMRSAMHSASATFQQESCVASYGNSCSYSKGPTVWMNTSESSITNNNMVVIMLIPTRRRQRCSEMDWASRFRIA